MKTAVLAVGAMLMVAEPVRMYGPSWRNTGYAPASANIGNLPQSLAIQYIREFRDNLKTNTAAFVRCATPVPMELNRGGFLDLFMYNTYGPNISQAAEGAVGSGLAPSVVNILAQIGEYMDYINFSSLSLFTAIDPAVMNLSVELAYRLAQSLAILVRNTADGETSFDATALTKLPATSTTVYTVNSLSYIRAAQQELAHRSVPPPKGEKNYCCAIDPLTWGDVINDTSNNSPIDILKHTDRGMAKIDELPTKDLFEGYTLPGTGIDFYPTNQVTTTANYNPGGGPISGLTALRTYIFGLDAVLRCELKAPGDTAYGDGDWRGVKCFMETNAKPSVADPEGAIPAWTSYRVHFTTTPPPDATTARLRMIDAASGLS